MMEVCGEAENKLAFEQSQHEVQLERDILDPLNQLAEVCNAKDLQITWFWTGNVGYISMFVLEGGYS